MDILDVMDLAAALEDRVGLLYHNFSTHFHANQAGLLFWEHISLEEKRHADMVRTCRRQRMLLPICRREHPCLMRDLEDAQRFVLEQLGQVEGEHIGEALDSAYRLEEQLGRAHLARIEEVSDPLLTKLLHRLGQEDHMHMERIQRMARSVTG